MDFEGIEKRRFVRANFPCKIIIFTPPEHTILTHTENIGAGGIRVIIEEKIGVGEIVGLEIYLNETKNPISCKGRIVWVMEKQSLYRKNLLFFDTGIEFYEIKKENRETIKNLVEAIVFEKNDFRKD